MLVQVQSNGVGKFVRRITSLTGFTPSLLYLLPGKPSQRLRGGVCSPNHRLLRRHKVFLFVD